MSSLVLWTILSNNGTALVRYGRKWRNNTPKARSGQANRLSCGPPSQWCTVLGTDWFVSRFLPQHRQPSIGKKRLSFRTLPITLSMTEWLLDRGCPNLCHPKIPIGGTTYPKLQTQRIRSSFWKPKGYDLHSERMMAHSILPLMQQTHNCSIVHDSKLCFVRVIWPHDCGLGKSS